MFKSGLSFKHKIRQFSFEWSACIFTNIELRNKIFESNREVVACTCFLQSSNAVSRSYLPPHPTLDPSSFSLTHPARQRRSCSCPSPPSSCHWRPAVACHGFSLYIIPFLATGPPSCNTLQSRPQWRPSGCPLDSLADVDMVNVA